MDDEFGPEEFERQFGVSKRAYEDRLLALTRAEMAAVIREDAPAAYADCGIEVRGTLEDVKLVGDDLDTEIVVLFHLAEGSGLFGWRDRIWPAPNPHDEMGSPEDLANLNAIDLVETVQSTLFSTLTSNRDREGRI